MQYRKDWFIAVAIINVDDLHIIRESLYKHKDENPFKSAKIQFSNILPTNTSLSKLTIIGKYTSQKILMQMLSTLRYQKNHFTQVYGPDHRLVNEIKMKFDILKVTILQ